MVKMATILNIKKKKMMMQVLSVVLVCVANGGTRTAAQVHHVVGNDQGWEKPSDLASWISGRVFHIGDSLWFAYSSASESIMELQTFEEFMSCDLRNPIRMYSKGLDKVALDSQGTRYFSSGNLESCKNGLKLPVTVQAGETKPLPERLAGIGLAADAPVSPSAAAPRFTSGLCFAWIFGFMVSCCFFMFMGV